MTRPWTATPRSRQQHLNVFLASLPGSKGSTTSSHESSVAAAQVQWTTTRCHRLLRPLTSRVAILRRHREHRARGSLSCCMQPLGVVDPNARKRSSLKSDILDTEKDQDLAWTQSEPQRKTVEEDILIKKLRPPPQRSIEALRLPELLNT